MKIDTESSVSIDQPPPFQFRLVHLFAMAIIGGVLAAFVPLFRWAKRAADEDICRNNLKQIALALHNYHDVYGHFPAAYQVDVTGKPMHSWRISIWNFMESQPYFVLYDFSEAWNGPNNSQLARHMSPCYRCPADSVSSPLMTNYVAIVGNGTMWPGSKSSTLEDITDGASDTIMVVEISNSDIHWMEPRDLPIEELETWLDPNHTPRIFGHHIDGSFVMHADGSIELLPRNVTIERLRAMITPAGKD
jgi:type II secretory pathway pseudopilin PulG